MLRKIGLLTLILALFGFYSWTQRERPVEVATFSSTTRPPAGQTETSTSVQAGPATLISATREQFEARFPSSWQFLTSEDGSIRSILGGQAQGYENSARGALRFARDIAPLLGARPEELQANEIAVLNTPLRRAYQVLQTYQGFPVYQSQVTVFFLNGSDTIVSLNSQLQKIDRLNSVPVLNQDAIEDALIKAVPLENLALSGPVVFVEGNVAYPAYVAVGTRSDMHEGWEFVVDAGSGDILHQYARNPDEGAGR